MEIVVNHLTRMRKGHICVAGLDETGRHVRPVLSKSRQLESRFAFGQGALFSIGAVVDLAETQPCPRPPAVEDHVFTPAEARRVRIEDGEPFWACLERQSRDSLGEIFGDALVRRNSGTASMAHGTGSVSLGMLRLGHRPVVVEPHPKRADALRLRFSDPELGQLWLPLTDLRLVDPRSGKIDQDRVKLLGDRLRRSRKSRGTALVSVGVGRAWSGDGREPRHWLQVNNVHLPDNPLWPCRPRR